MSTSVHTMPTSTKLGRTCWRSPRFPTDLAPDLVKQPPIREPALSPVDPRSANGKSATTSPPGDRRGRADTAPRRAEARESCAHRASVGTPLNIMQARGFQ